MKRISLGVFALVMGISLYAQKPSLDFKAIENFPEILDASISNDGNFIAYVVDYKNEGTSLLLKAVNNLYVKEIKGLPKYFSSFKFTDDSRRFIFQRSEDTLSILDLASKKEDLIPNCISFTLLDENAQNWIAYVISNRKLILHNFNTRDEKVFLNVESYKFSPNGKILLLNQAPENENSICDTLSWVDLTTGGIKKIYVGDNAIDPEFDYSSKRVAFVTLGTNNDRIHNKIFLYEDGMAEAHMLVSNKNLPENGELAIANYRLNFSKDGQKLFFYVTEVETSNHEDMKLGSTVHVWSYKDKFLQSELAAQVSLPRNYLAAYNFKNNNVTRIEQREDSYGAILNTAGNGNYLMTRTSTNLWEEFRDSTERPNVILTNTSTGERICLKEKMKNILASQINFSTGGKYVYWYDSQQKAYFTYNILTRKISNVSKEISVPLYNEVWDYIREPDPYYGVRWSENDEDLFVCDRYDIWKIDPDGKAVPVNITRGYGRKSRTVLRFIYLRNKYEEPALVINDSLFLCGFNEETKRNAFFKVNLTKIDPPVVLNSSLELSYFSDNISFVSFPNYIRKAKFSNVYLLKKESATEYPNLVVTKDFKSFNYISHINPQKTYNWISSELVSWRDPSGQQGQGILYKPENFDTTKQYPIIVLLYERQSDGFNRFIPPGLSYAAINIPYFVSNEYVVFCPDIYYTAGSPGESTYNYVMSAVNYISNGCWTDKKKIGLQGHSFGGYEVDYLITKTNLFSAAASASGDVNLVSAAGDIIKGGKDNHKFIEEGQYRMKETMWQNRMAYIRNSPIFDADKINTPLLIMHNKEDAAVNWAQGVELFTALRRLNKPVWMLQYDGEGHVIQDPRNQLDFTIRIKQFFDYYLKDSETPNWMK